MTSEEKAQLRLMLGEVIPPGGSDADTMFRDDELTDLFEGQGANLTLAALEGWRLKAAQYASLVDITEVGEGVKLSQLHGAALRMVQYYESLSGLSSTKVHKLSR